MVRSWWLEGLQRGLDGLRTQSSFHSAVVQSLGSSLSWAILETEQLALLVMGCWCRGLSSQHSCLHIPGTFWLEGNEWAAVFYLEPGRVRSVAGAGRDTLLPVDCSKNSSGNIAEGKRRGLLGSWVRATHPFLFLSGLL